MNKIEINKRKYSYKIEPSLNMVEAKIYKECKLLFQIGQPDHQITIQSKSFGKWYRNPNEEDYINAKAWAENQLKWILNANK
ncbi:MAG: hypothetical protein J5I47_01930 [Vicingus serpentipes]|nr:hypothetical protein [Vicingus serpentipes]